MPTSVLTDRERAAVQAYLRLLHTVRAAFDAADDQATGRGTPDAPPAAPTPTPTPTSAAAPTSTSTAAPTPPRPPAPTPVALPPSVPPSVLAEAEQALAAAGLRGNEEEFFRLLRSCRPRG
ncbi:hypothetical protein [Streptomyces sp. enrichment culture]|uniref:hypothetical protein n=1 Tax=Streptomyces sp. enrichment culture TaxID=1795815 RepID=UPI003F57FDAE